MSFTLAADKCGSLQTACNSIVGFFEIVTETLRIVIGTQDNSPEVLFLEYTAEHRYPAEKLNQL